MSRIGKLPIPVPGGVKATISEDTVTVQGPKGTLKQWFDQSAISVAVQDNKIQVARKSDHRKHRAAHGLYRSLFANMVRGVSLGFSRALEINGVGYRAEKKGKILVLYVGHSLPQEVEMPQGIDFEIQKNKIVLSSIDKQLLGQVAANVRSVRPPDPYKGKGIKYEEEVLRKKVGKTTA